MEPEHLMELLFVAADAYGHRIFHAPRPAPRVKNWHWRKEEVE